MHWFLSDKRPYPRSNKYVIHIGCKMNTFDFISLKWLEIYIQHCKFSTSKVLSTTTYYFYLYHQTLLPSMQIFYLKSLIYNHLLLLVVPPNFTTINANFLPQKSHLQPLTTFTCTTKLYYHQCKFSTILFFITFLTCQTPFILL